MSKYELIVTSGYARKAKKILKKDPLLKKKVLNILYTLSKDPFSNTLKTHIIGDSEWGRVYSSRVTRDIRVIWMFQDSEIILLQSIGGHSGGWKVYK